MSKYSQKELNMLAKKIAKKTGKGDTIKADKHGNITNWNDLSEATRQWIKNG